MKIERNIMKNVDRLNDEPRSPFPCNILFRLDGLSIVFTLNFKAMSREATFAATSDMQSQMSESVLKRIVTEK
jgi:hypothetical protein